MSWGYDAGGYQHGYAAPSPAKTAAHENSPVISKQPAEAPSPPPVKRTGKRRR